MRSMLLVPVSDAALVDRAFAAGADAVVLDVAASDQDADNRGAARRSARDILRTAQFDAHRPHLYVRLEGLDGDHFDADLAAVMVGEPDGIFLAGCRSGRDVQQLGARLAVQEAEFGLTDGETGIVAEAGTTARSIFRLDTYGDASPRLVGLAWHAERFASDLGGDHDPLEFDTLAPLHTVRHLTLFAARAADVAAIDTATATRDDASFLAACTTARKLGFNAKLTGDVKQVATINAVFGRE